ncbi:hypothetical protein Mapa_010450 [Marchantia paleacea]|nr:hypothetical protein Mapa_010450 [Marchantia paleacea]
MVAKPKKNLLSRKCGEGPPIAPEGWKWRAGLRKQDMYFTAPDGTRFRSKRPLNEYLRTLSNPPAPADFCWSITPEVLAHPALQAFKTATPPKKSAQFKKKAKASSKSGGEPAAKKPRK